MTFTTTFTTMDMTPKIINRLLPLLTALCISFASLADNHGQRQKWMENMRQAKHEFLTKELKLSETQCRDFFPLYDKMTEERMALEKKLRCREQEVLDKGDKATDREIDAVIDDQYSIDIKLNDIDRKYLPRFKSILSRPQLLRLKHAERKFQRQLMQKKRSSPTPHGKKKQ